MWISHIHITGNIVYRQFLMANRIQLSVLNLLSYSKCNQKQVKYFPFMDYNICIWVWLMDIKKKVTQLNLYYYYLFLWKQVILT